MAKTVGLLKPKQEKKPAAPKPTETPPAAEAEKQ